MIQSEPLMDQELLSLGSMNLVRRALARWDAVVASVHPVARSENLVYRFRDSAGRERYLRISRPYYRPRQEIEAELDFVRHLHARGVPVAPPVASRRGKWVETLRGPKGEQYAAVFEAVYGQDARWGSDEEQNCRMILARGKALGRMHHAARRYRPSGDFSRFHWFEDDLFTDPGQYFPRRDVDARREYQALIHWMLDRPATRENYGIVHGDFGSGNMLRREDGSLVAFDFDDCLHHWYLYDLAVSIRSAASMPFAQRRKYVRAMLDGYAEEKDLSGDGPQELAQFCRLGALYRYVTLLREFDRRRMKADQRRALGERLEALRHPLQWH
jgi:Ser/Thr protein kinase RdoA (MazF antagonist)